MFPASPVRTTHPRLHRNGGKNFSALSINLRMGRYCHYQITADIIYPDSRLALSWPLADISVFDARLLKKTIRLVRCKMMVAVKFPSVVLVILSFTILRLPMFI